MKPTISCIIPTYERNAELIRAIRSVLEQTLIPEEIIVVDDGSKNICTKEIVQSFNSPLLQYLQLQENQGVSAARNYGIAKANSEWIALLDSDDEWAIEKLEKQANFISENHDIELIHCNEKWIRNGEPLAQLKKHRKSGGSIFLNCLPLCVISPSAALFKKELWANLGGFREDFPVCEDYDFWLKATLRGPVGFIKEELITKYGGHQDQLSHKYHSMDYWRILALSSIAKEIALKSPLNLTFLKKTHEEIIKKAEILIKGYKKYGDNSQSNEIREIQCKSKEQLNTLLTQT